MGFVPFLILYFIIWDWFCSFFLHNSNVFRVAGLFLWPFPNTLHQDITLCRLGKEVIMVLIYRTKKLGIMQHWSLSPPHTGNVRWKSAQNIPGTGWWEVSLAMLWYEIIWKSQGFLRDFWLPLTLLLNWSVCVCRRRGRKRGTGRFGHHWNNG